MNPASGNGTVERVGLVARARELGVEVVEFVRSDDRAGIVRAAVDDGADVLGMAGGDGSLALVAEIAAEMDLPFVCIPAGTRNHFALDLGIDRRDPVAALEAFTDPREGRIDLGNVNGRAFVNNVSLGLYGDAVQRPEYRDAKIRTLIEVAEEVRGPSVETSGMRVVDDIGDEHVDPVALLVSNNPYGLEPPHRIGSRPSLDSGILGVVVVDRPSPGAPPGRAWTSERVRIDAGDVVHAGIDGEAVDLAAPVFVRIRPSALRVRIAATARPGHLVPGP